MADCLFLSDVYYKFEKMCREDEITRVDVKVMNVKRQLGNIKMLRLLLFIGVRRQNEDPVT